MTHPRIEGGYYIKARSIADSDIMRSPPYVREVWDWLLRNANHKDNKTVKRGQVFTTLDEICEGLCWFVGYRKVSYTKDHMKKAMKALKNASMITTNKSTRGFLITLCNYEIYQDPKNYESTNESSNESTIKAPSKHHESLHDKQECKNDKNVKKEEVSLGDFDDFWNRYGKIGNRKQALKFYNNTTKEGVTHETIIRGVERYQRYCIAINQEARYIKHASTWLNSNGWEDEYAIPATASKQSSAHDNVTKGIELLLSRRAGQQEY